MIATLVAYALSSTVVIDAMGYQWFSERQRPALPITYVAMPVEEFDRRCPGKLMCERPDVAQKRCWVYYPHGLAVLMYSDTPPSDYDAYAIWHARNHCNGYDHR